MAKRFTDTGKWKHDWFDNAPPKQKLLWLFICDDCDSVGIWQVNFKRASYSVGETVGPEDLKAISFDEKSKEPRIVEVSHDSVWLTGFINFQYKTLNPKNSAHRGMMRQVLSAVGDLPLVGNSKDLIESFKKHLDDGQTTLERGSDDSTGKGLGLGLGNGQGKEFSDFVNLFVKNLFEQNYPKKEGLTKALEILTKPGINQIKDQSDAESFGLAVVTYAKTAKTKKPDFVKNFESFAKEWRDWVLPGAGKVVIQNQGVVSTKERLDELEAARANSSGDVKVVESILGASPSEALKNFRKGVAQ